MVKFTESAFEKEDHIFVKEDPVRIYRGLKDLLVEEFDVDRVEEGHMEFNVQKPKDKIRLAAFKEKSPHTVIMFDLGFRAKSPKDIYKLERPDDILKARVKVKAKVITMYPGQNPAPWLPGPVTDDNYRDPGLRAEEHSPFQKSKLYKVLVGIWYNKFYKSEIERYENEAEEISLRIHDLMREKFGIEKSIYRTGSAYDEPW